MSGGDTAISSVLASIQVLWSYMLGCDAASEVDSALGDWTGLDWAALYLLLFQGLTLTIYRHVSMLGSNPGLHSPAADFLALGPTNRTSPIF